MPIPAMCECVLIAARGESDPAGAVVALLLFVVCLVVVVLELTASYNVVTKNGAPYCPLCNRQVSLRRDHCRSCGFRFKTYGLFDSTSTRSHQADPKPFIDPILADAARGTIRIADSSVRALGRGLRRVASLLVTIFSCRWLGDLPDWFQPIAWAAMTSGLVAAPAIKIQGNPGVGVFLACMAWAALGFSAVVSVIGAVWQRRLGEAHQSQDLAIPRFVDALLQELRTRPAREFDLDAMAAGAGVPRRVAEIAAEKVYVRFARAIVADGIVTRMERYRIDRLADLLGLDPDLARRIEDAARVERYHDAVAEILSDGVVTPEERLALDEMRHSLGIPEDEVAKEQAMLDDVDSESRSQA